MEQQLTVRGMRHLSSPALHTVVRQVIVGPKWRADVHPVVSQTMSMTRPVSNESESIFTRFGINFDTESGNFHNVGSHNLFITGRVGIWYPLNWFLIHE